MKSLAAPVTAAIAFALAGCQSMSPASPQAQVARLAGTTWHVESIRDVAVAANVVSTLEIDGKAQVAGVGGCNAYVSNLEVESQTIRFAEPSTANVPCKPDQADQEIRFFDALALVRGSRIENDRLLLLDEKNMVILRLAPGSLSLQVR
jgi:heat shock protein HslJ